MIIPEQIIESLIFILIFYAFVIYLRLDSVLYKLTYITKAIYCYNLKNIIIDKNYFTSEIEKSYNIIESILLLSVCIWKISDLSYIKKEHRPFFKKEIKPFI